MSCYEWEAGNIKIPSAEWAKVKLSIRKDVNAYQQVMLEAAEDIYNVLTVKLPELKKQVAAKTINAFMIETKLYEIAKERLDLYARRRGVTFHEGASNTILMTIAFKRDPKDWNKHTIKLKKPLKKDFPIHNGAVNHFDDGDCSLTFDNDTRTVRWDVPENNHACDRAREGTLGKAFFKAMESVTWTRDSGGSIYGNDEYNRESGHDYEGGGGTLLKATFSAEQQKRDRERSRNSYNSYRGFMR